MSDGLKNAIATGNGLALADIECERLHAALDPQTLWPLLLAADQDWFRGGHPFENRWLYIANHVRAALGIEGYSTERLRELGEPSEAEIIAFSRAASEATGQSLTKLNITIPEIRAGLCAARAALLASRRVLGYPQTEEPT